MGALASLTSLPTTLCLAAAAMLIGSLLGPMFPLRMGEHKNITQVVPFEDLLVADTPLPGAGPTICTSAPAPPWPIGSWRRSF